MCDHTFAIQLEIFFDKYPTRNIAQKEKKKEKDTFGIQLKEQQINACN
jgi:hypothetical protein